MKIPNNLIPEDLGVKKTDQDEVIREFGHIHHKDGNSNNNDYNNLILLCPSCHAKLHAKMRKKLINPKEII